LERALQQTQMTLRSFIQTVPSVIVGLSSRGRIIEFNAEAEKLLGCSREEVMGEKYVDLFIPPSSRKEVDAEIKNLLANGLPNSFVNRVKAPNGDELTINGITFSIGANESVLKAQHGVFVSIKKHGVLRGCIGTIAPTQKTTLDEIVKNAISACSKDYRFDPISSDELDALTISVDVLSQLSRVEDLETLSPDTHGVVVFSKEKMGVLLPNLEGIKTLEEQLKVASNKGGFSVDDIDEIQSFTVERFY